MTDVKTKRVKVNLQELKVSNLDGSLEEMKGLDKVIANLLYKCTGTLDVLEIARSINRGEEVELSKTEAKEIMAVLTNPQVGVVARIQEAVKNLLTEKEAL